MDPTVAQARRIRELTRGTCVTLVLAVGLLLDEAVFDTGSWWVTAFCCVGAAWAVFVTRRERRSARSGFGDAGREA